jgi:hypothetical protein
MMWIHDVDHPERGATSLRLEDVWETGHDATGHVFTAPLTGQGSAAAYFDGQPVASARDPNLAPSPDGDRSLEDTRQGDTPTTRMVDGAGLELWAAPLERNALTWLDRTRLVYTPSSGGFAIVDGATGEVANARAGWGFELATSPHVRSTVGRPLARVVARGRDPEIQLTANAAFQQLARAIAAASSTRVLEWGHVMLDGQPTRTALLKRPGETGTPLFAYVFETAPGEARVITITGWGFSQFQGFDEPAREPPWGTALEPEVGLQHARTIERTTLAIGTKWIHGSFEQLAIGLAHGEPVVAADEWVERENNGHGFDETADRKAFARARPLLATYKLHALRVRISAASRDAGVLADGIVESPLGDVP